MVTRKPCNGCGSTDFYETEADGYDVTVCHCGVAQSVRATRDWRPASETPPIRFPCVLQYDCPHDAGLDEALSIGWHDGERWHDVHGAAADPGAWLVAWLPLPSVVVEQSQGGAK